LLPRARGSGGVDIRAAAVLAVISDGFTKGNDAAAGPDLIERFQARRGWARRGPTALATG